MPLYQRYFRGPDDAPWGLHSITWDRRGWWAKVRLDKLDPSLQPLDAAPGRNRREKRRMYLGWNGKRLSDGSENVYLDKHAPELRDEIIDYLRKHVPKRTD